MELIVNPSLSFESKSSHENKLDIAAETESGRQKVTIYRSQHPNLFRIFGELSQTNLNLLDVEKDLNEIEREFLFEYGVLIEK